MKALRYLLMAIAILGVLSVSAQTHQYGATHYSSHEQAIYTGVQVNPQMPTATMGYTNSDYMTSGSTLPQAAVTGVTTADGQESSGRNGHIRRGADEGDTPPENPHGPMEDPIGDAAIPLALLAGAYVCVRAFRKKRA